MTTPIMKLPTLRYQRYILWVVVILSFIRCLSNDYSLDDATVTTKEKVSVAKGFAGIKEILLSPYNTGFDGTDAFDYRPVTLITFAVEKGIFGFNASASHLINLLLYLFLVLLVFKTLRKLLQEYPEWITLTVTLIFAIHPLHSEVVISLKNREEMLVSLFGFGAFWYLINYFESKKWMSILMVVLFMALGINTKATVSPFILFIPLSLFFFKRISLKSSLLVLVGLVIVSTAALMIPRSFIETDLSREIEYFENPLFFMPFTARIPMAFYSFLIYCKLHILPYPLLSYYGYSHIEILGWTDFQVYIGIAITGILIYLLIKPWRKKPLLAYGIITFGIFMSPYQNFPIASTGIIAERFAFNSVLGIGLIIAAVISANPLTGNQWNYTQKGKSYLKIALCAILILFTFLNISRTGDWKNELSLIRTDVAKAPQSVKLQMLHGELAQKNIALTQNQQIKNSLINEAKTAYQQVIKLYPKHAATYNNLGVIYSLSGNYTKAIPLIVKAIELGDDKAENYFNLGACYEISGNMKKAKENYRAALSKNKRYAPALERLKVLGN